MARRLTLHELAANVRAADVDLPIEVEALLGRNGDRQVLAADSPALSALDWAGLIRDGVPPVEYLHHPYFPRGARIWTWGGTGLLDRAESAARRDPHRRADRAEGEHAGGAAARIGVG